MDKGGGEHQVALQRLEDALVALNAKISTVREHLSKNRQIFHEKYFFMDWLRVHQSFVANVLALKTFWPELDETKLPELIRFVEESTAELAQFEATVDARGGFQKQDVISALVAWHYPLKQIVKARKELQAIRLSFICSDGMNPQTRLEVEPERSEIARGTSEDLRQTEALNLAREFRSHGESLVADFKNHHIVTKLPLISNGLLSAIFFAALAGQLLDESRSFKAITLIITCLVFALYFGYQFEASLKERMRLKESANARARLLILISDYIVGSKGMTISPTAREVISFAIEHQDVVLADPKAINLRTETLRTLVAANPQNG
jgi:hypothetical protein